MKKIFLFFLIFLSFFSFAQRPDSKGKIGVLTGSVLDSLTKKPLEYCAVRIVSTLDSSVVAGIYTDEGGDFLLDQIPFGKYHVKISLLNYKTKWIDNLIFSVENFDRTLGVIRLDIDQAQDLDEIQVVANKKLLTTSFDKKVYDVSADLSSVGGSVNDVLNNVPSVEVDQDGKISLRGDGNVTILIDGKPSVLSGGSGKSLLDALPAELVERIEIVTNPSAKYDPDGTSGIINIVLKKNKYKGINGNVSVSAATGDLYNGSASLSVRNSKFNFYGTYAYRHYEGERNNYGLMNRYFGDSLFRLNQNRLGTDYNAGNTLKFGTDYFINTRNTIGLSLTGNNGERNRYGDLVNTQLDSLDNILLKWNRESFDPSKQLNADINLNYKHDFKEDKGMLTFDITQSIAQDTTGGDYNQSYDPSYSIRLPYSQKLGNKEVSKFTTAMLDFTHVYPKNIRVEAGVKMILRDVRLVSSSQTEDSLTKVFYLDTLSTFEYKYNEQIFSSYGNFAQHINKFKYQVGVRVEESYQVPNLISENLEYVKSYFNVFPSAFLTYSFKKNIELTLNYSKRINRPTSDNLNPFTSYADPYNLRRGNPAVNPEFIDSYEIGFGYLLNKFSLNSSVYYRNTTDVLQRYRVYYADGSAAVTYINLDRSENIGFELVASYKTFSWFKNVFSFNGNQIKYYDKSVVFASNYGFYWSLKYVGNITFWKKTATVQLNGKYNAPIVTAQGTVQPRASLDISFEKKIKDSKWVLGAKITDVFNSKEFVINVNQPFVVQNSTFKQTTRRFYVTAAYKFGKLEINKKSRVNSDNSGGGMDF